MRWIVLALRLVLGAIFVYAGYVKLREPWALFAMGIDSYHILPLKFVEPVARALPWFEVVIGVLLMAGVWMKFSSACVSAMLLVFVGAMIKAMVNHEAINCGCFGPGEPISKWTMLRDGSMLAGSLFLTVMAFVRRRPAA